MICLDSEKVGNWVAEKLGRAYQRRRGAALGWVNAEGALVAGIILEDWSIRTIWAHIYIEEGVRPPAGFYKTFEAHLWRTLQVTSCRAIVCSCNWKCRKFLHKYGWQVEAVLSDFSPEGDGIIFKLTPETSKYGKCT